ARQFLQHLLRQVTMRGIALTERTQAPGDGGSAEDFGANAWLVDEMYKQYIVDKNSVDKAWWPTLERLAASNGQPPAAKAAPAAPAGQSTLAPTSSSPDAATGQTESKTTNVAPRQAPIPA